MNCTVEYVLCSHYKSRRQLCLKLCWFRTVENVGIICFCLWKKARKWAIWMDLAESFFQRRICWDCLLSAGLMGSHEQKCKKSTCASSNMGMFHFPENSHTIELLNKHHFTCSRSNRERHLTVDHLSQYYHQNQLIVQKVCRISPLKENGLHSFI